MVQLSRRTVLLAGVAWGVTELGLNNVHAQDSTRPGLPIPAELRADAGRTIRLDARPGSMRFVGDRQTATYGINGPYLGPAVRVRHGEKVVAQVSNNVPETITMHWHGLIIPGAADGGPHQVIPSGKQWQTERLQRRLSLLRAPTPDSDSCCVIIFGLAQSQDLGQHFQGY